MKWKFEEVGYAEKYDDNWKIWSFIALALEREQILGGARQVRLPFKSTAERHFIDKKVH